MRLAIGFKGRKLIFAAAVGAIAALLAVAAPAYARDKVALIIGNGAYREVPELPNPPHDAADVAAAFERLGFSVQLVTNASYEDMRRALLKFSGKARNADMAVVFFAGHGMEMGGENWLIPVDAELKTDLDVDQEAISLRAIMLMVSAAPKLGLVILDACRNNPFLGRMRRTITTRSLGRGLTRVEPANNVLVAYSAKDGTTAGDGDGRNSPFTTALLKYLEVPGLEINFLFRDVRDDVIASTSGEQEPFVYGSLSRESIYFKPPPAPPSEPSADAVTWSLLKETTDEDALKRFVAQYPNSSLRKDAEARIVALQAAAAAKPVPPRPDEVTWMLLKETTDEDALKRFVAQYPNSSLRKDATARIAAIETARAAQPTPPSPGQIAWNMVKDTTDVNALKRFVAQYPDSALREDAEARIATLQTARAAQPAPPPADEIAWNLVKDSTDAGELRRFVKQFPASGMRAQAEQRVAALTAATAKTASVDSHALARSLQSELKRVGCFTGTTNGEFDDATRAAVHAFVKLTSINLANPPSPEAIDAVRKFDKRVCPLACPAGERADGERCVPGPAAKPHQRNAERSEGESRRKAAAKRSREERPKQRTAIVEPPPTASQTAPNATHPAGARRRCSQRQLGGAGGARGMHALPNGGCGY